MTVNDFLKEISKSKVSEMPQSAKSWSISERKGLRMKKTPLQIFEERNEKDCCLNCKKLIVKQTGRRTYKFLWRNRKDHSRYVP